MKPSTWLNLSIAVIGFPLNLFFEYLHMPLFKVSFLYGYIDSRLTLSILSALLNLIWTYAIYEIMVSIFGKSWIRNWTVLKAAVVIVSGMVVVSVGEIIALTTELWSYGAAMPIIPFLGIGLTPFLIISIIPLVTFYLVSKFT